MKSLKLRTYAKVNLGLYITGIREDGYHELSSIFLPIDLHDVLTVEPNNSLKVELNISTSGPFAKGCPTDERNTVYKAFSRLRERFKIDTGLNVHIEKNISVGGGLGGGSSNAAGFLHAASQIYGLDIGNDKLKSIGVSVGADVPFFIDSRPALVEGIGEVISPFEVKRDYWLIVAKPKRGVSTKDVYQNFSFDLTLKVRNAKYREYLRSLSSQGIEKAEELKTLHNDLEAVSSVILPEIACVREYLEGLDPVVSMMSGSGSAVFALFDREVTGDFQVKDDWFLCTTKILRGHYGDYRNQNSPSK